jgi:hypothetical protein
MFFECRLLPDRDLGSVPEHLVVYGIIATLSLIIYAALLKFKVRLVLFNFLFYYVQVGLPVNNTWPPLIYVLYSVEEKTIW